MINLPWLNPFQVSSIVNALIALLFVGTPMLILLALWQLRHHHLQGIELALWVIIILVFPIFGALASFITLGRGPLRNRNTG